MTAPTKLQQESGYALKEIVDAMVATGVSIDSCLLAAEIARDTGRALGYRTTVRPVRVRVRGPNGEVGRELGYSEEPPDPSRYPAHAVAIWEGKVGLDPTAPQMSANGLEVPALTFNVPPGLKSLRPWDVELPNGVMLHYDPFDGGGDWMRGLSGEMSRDSLRTARLIAKRIRG